MIQELMKILYFDTFSLFYSKQYINSHLVASLAYKSWCNKPNGNLLSVVRPDLAGIERLRKSAIESGFKLYPLGTRYTRTLFIESGLLSEDALAPDEVLRLRLGDNDPIRRIIAHSHILNATWYVCGDIGPSLPNSLINHHLTSSSGNGVTDELLSKIRELKTIE